MTDQDMLTHYSAALDEIYRLRAALAYEARVIELMYLCYKTIPKVCRTTASDQIVRMRAAAQGNAATAVYYINFHRELEDAGAPTTLTRHAWENRGA